MAESPHSPDRAARKPDRDLLFKGVLCAAIGLAVVFGPSFMADSPLRQMVGQSTLVGWFALVLGAAFIAQFLWQRSRVQRLPSDGA